MDEGEEKETIGSGGGGGGTMNSLLCLCVRKLAFNWEPAQMDQLRTVLPASLFLSIVNLIEDVKKLATIYPTDVIQRLPEKCFVMNPESRKLDVEKTILASEPFLSKLDFFDLCSKMALEQPAERVYQSMSESEQDKLENMDSIEPVVWCRALELSPRRAILHYDDIALSCAAGGYLRALERNLLKVRGGEDTALLQRCALTAILNGHFHVANAIQIDNFSTAFHYFFPDGHPPPTFIANLLDTKLLKPEVGEQIFEEIIDWLSKLDVQWLMRAIEREEPKIPGYVRQRLEWKYRECVDRREYPCNDWD